ncbi:MAG TPA: short-chain dehydrogenase [Polaromonas sp.]|uniref:NnrS family protein n=1 Tax=Polaromonas sp. UBA4122 TaxID=1947074 RepID=UPI000EBC1889|nr:NnrS family protein [Polaromonas sp. UBA4122]HAL37864.1 short-chain dehydrogenase [Polaromonas sp.]
MNQRPVIPLRVTQGKPSAEERAKIDHRWHARYLLLAPHRLGFFLAMVVLVASGAWWALVQFDRVSAVLALPYALSPSLVHAAVMTFGFIPLFFSGFLFTAGPKWLGVPPLEVQLLLAPLLLQATGWLLWLTGAHLHALISVAALVMAWTGLVRITWLFWRLIRLSRAEDQLHARTIGVACVAGCLSLAGLVLSLVLDAPAVALACILTGLWGFVLVVFVSVAHRMIPFFTSSAMPLVAVWRPFWVLWLMLAAATVEVAAVWVELDGPLQGPAASVWMLARGIFELATGGVLLWLAVVWGLVQSLKNRLLAMLHIGFLWLGLALVLGGISQLLGLLQGAPVLGLGSLHALTMGCLASLMLAMVTRVSCGHSGRALVADRLVWSLFWLLQAATVLRIAAAVQSALAGWLLFSAALLWATVMAVWGVRLGSWHGHLRADGRPG